MSERPEAADQAAQAAEPEAAAADLLVEEAVAADLLVEEVSIDGMCGVY